MKSPVLKRMTAKLRPVNKIDGFAKRGKPTHVATRFDGPGVGLFEFFDEISGSFVPITNDRYRMGRSSALMCHRQLDSARYCFVNVVVMSLQVERCRRRVAR
ncbi:MAG: hypothetical protein ABI461_13820 [Polyangiaceae bacterium]